jgi:hypothetical protein
MTDVFYDPQNSQLTIAMKLDEVSLIEDNGSYVITFENVNEIEFYWPDQRLWRAVKDG